MRLRRLVRRLMDAASTSLVGALLLPAALLAAAFVIFATGDVRYDDKAMLARGNRIELLVASQRAMTEATALRLALLEYQREPSIVHFDALRLKHEVLFARIDMLSRGAFRSLLARSPIARQGHEEAARVMKSFEALFTTGADTTAQIAQLDALAVGLFVALERISAESILLSAQINDDERSRAEANTNVRFGALGFVLVMVAAGLAMSMRQNRKLSEARTKAQALSERYLTLAQLDTLTGLPNRAYGHSLGEQLIARARAADADVAVLCLDVDRFKQINDVLGHAAGDDLLKIVGGRLSAIVLEDGDMIASRVGGDEFWMCRVLKPGEDVVGWAERVAEALRSGNVLDGHQVAISTSGGLAVEASSRADLKVLLAHADMALRAAKERGRAQTALYQGGLAEARARRLAVESALKGALEREEFHLAYQPVVSTRGRGVDCVEALLRWTHPQLGFVSPAEFIPIAEDAGLITSIGEWVLRKACADIGPQEGLRVSVNVSAAQLLRMNLAQTVRLALAASGLPPARLQLEITETALIRNEQLAASFLDEMEALGVDVALDDFGVGYSSLSYLRRFKVRGLKIDRSFTQDLESSPKARALARAIVDMARALDLKVTAEGVETQSQALALSAEGCDALQGYLFARPMPLEQLRDWLAMAAPEFAAAS